MCLYPVSIYYNTTISGIIRRIERVFAFCLHHLSAKLERAIYRDVIVFATAQEIKNIVKRALIRERRLVYSYVLLLEFVIIN